MIDVGYLYDKVEDILVKNQSGYSGNDQFNRDLVLMQQLLMEFLLPNSDNERTHESLRKFIKTVSGSGTIAYPSDWQYKLNAKAHQVIGDVAEHGAYFMATDELYLELESPIRKPSVKGRFRYALDSDGIKCYPTTVPFTISYVRQPTVATRAVTPDNANDVENYNAGASVHLEWPESELPRVVDIMCWLRGVQVNKSEVVNWLASKQVTMTP